MSGELWFGSLPAGWQPRRLKIVAACVVSNVDKIAIDGETPIHLCNYTDVYNNEFITSSLEFMASTGTQIELERFSLHVGDVLITKDSESWDDIGIPALVVESADDLVCGYHLALLRPKPGVLDGRYLFRCLQSRAVRLSLELAATGITRFGLSG